MSDEPMSEETVADTQPAEAGVEHGELLAPGEVPDPQVDEGAESAEDDDEAPVPHGAVTEPAKVMRIGSMVRQLLEEVRETPLDEASRERLAEVYERSVVELTEAISPDLSEELRMLALPFSDDEVPSEAEIRIAKAQLVGWLEGLFHGIQASLVAQQMAARHQLEQMRQLNAGEMQGGPGAPDGTPGVQPQQTERPGTYLCLVAGSARRVFFDEGEGTLAAAMHRDREDDPVHAEFPVGPHGLGPEPGRWGDADLQPAELVGAARLLGRLPQPLDVGRRGVDVAEVAVPTVPHPDGAPRRGVAVPADHGVDIGLGRFRVGGDPIEPHELVVDRHRVGRPQCPHGLEVPVGAAAPAGDRCVAGLELARDVPDPEPEQQAPAPEGVERGEALGEYGRTTLGEDDDAGAQLDPLSSGREKRQ